LRMSLEGERDGLLTTVAGTIQSVSEATQRTDVEYTWPEALVRPSPDVRLVYLDQKDWINLAKAATSHPGGRLYADALDVLRDAKASGHVVFPLSMTHLMEMSGTKNPRHRFEVAEVMEELSGFATLIARSILMRIELEAVLDVVAKPRPQRYSRVPLVGHGVAFASGKQGQFRFRSGDQDVTEQVRQAHPGGVEDFDQLIAQAADDLNRATLRGPTDAEVPRLKSYGWDPTVARTIAEERAKQEREQAARFDNPPPIVGYTTRWRQERVRDAVRIRYIVFELLDMFMEGLKARGLEIEDVWGNPESARRVVDAMPSADVCVSLKTEYHRNPQFGWRSNDIFDIDALSVAVAYCDLIVTDKQAADALRRRSVPERLGSQVFTNLDELADVLRA
jgi:hypothetical protein